MKEERAKLKVQNYIMEKELRAIQISHQGHCLSESALRSQLNAIQIDRNLQMLKTSDRSGAQSPLAQQIEVNCIIIGIVWNHPLSNGICSIIIFDFVTIRKS